MPLWVGDYLFDTVALDLEEHGAYLLLIFAYWRRGEPLPDKDAEFCRLLNINARRWRRLRAILEPFFQVADGVWRHARIEAELDAARKRADKGRSAAILRHGTDRNRESLAVVSPNIDRSLAKERQNSGWPSLDLQGENPDSSICPGDAINININSSIRDSATSTAPHSVVPVVVGEKVDSGGSAARRHRGPDCPVTGIVAAYHELMPRNPRVRILGNTLRGYITSRWRDLRTLPGWEYDTEAEGLEAWRRFFAICDGSEFLTGKTEGTNGRPPFIADLAWIMRPTNFEKILANKYHRRAA
jgi:uncharacterized protein YdaU (DUF1376 family)